MKRILIIMHYMELGGAERALLGLLDALDPARVQVDLFLHQHTGAFMHLIPSWVNVLLERHGYRAIERPIKDAMCMGEWGVVWGRLKARRRSALYHKSLPASQQAMDSSVFHTVMTCVESHLPSLEDLGEYDLAISFLQPHNVVAHKVTARIKMGWIHTDYSTVHFNVAEELPVWSQLDYIASISPHCTTAFLTAFPSLEHKIVEMENILSTTLVRKQASEGAAPELATCTALKLVSVGRICHAKNYDIIPAVARLLVDEGLDFTWTIVGPGDASTIVAEARRLGVEKHVQFVGGKANPYPYIAAADIYLQPSRYEGKSVTVREAQMLHRPVIITAYPTAPSQVENGKDGIICPMTAQGIADAIQSLASDPALCDTIISYLTSHDYSNSTEVQKLYDILDLSQISQS